MIIADIIAGVLFAMLSGMGIGGGGLLVIYLTLTGTSQLQAQGLNLYFFLFASASSLFVHANRRNLNFDMLLIPVAAGIVGTLVGSGTAAVMHPDLARILFGWMLVLSGSATLIKSIYARAKKNKEG